MHRVKITTSHMGKRKLLAVTCQVSSSFIASLNRYELPDINNLQSPFKLAERKNLVRLA